MVSRVGHGFVWVSKDITTSVKEGDKLVNNDKRIGTNEFKRLYLRRGDKLVLEAGDLGPRMRLGSEPILRKPRPGRVRQVKSGQEADWHW